MMRANFRILAFLAAALVAIAGAARADDHVSTGGKFSVWLPDRWVATAKGDRIEAHNPADSVQVVVGRLKDADADLSDEDVADFVDDELDDMAISKDETKNLQGRETRVLEGTGRDEEDPVNFRAVAFDPGGAVLVALVYGDANVLGREEVSRAVERILRSVKPL
jgi:uncharacterized iron-regulated membrane protein